MYLKEFRLWIRRREEEWRSGKSAGLAIRRAEFKTPLTTVWMIRLMKIPSPLTKELNKISPTSTFNTSLVTVSTNTTPHSTTLPTGITSKISTSSTISITPTACTPPTDRTPPTARTPSTDYTPPTDHTPSTDCTPSTAHIPPTDHILAYGIPNRNLFCWPMLV